MVVREDSIVRGLSGRVLLHLLVALRAAGKVGSNVLGSVYRRWILACAGTLALTGCASFGERSVEEQSVLIDRYSALADELNSTVVFQFDHDGRIGFFYDQAAGLDVGVKMRATIIVTPDDDIAGD